MSDNIDALVDEWGEGNVQAAFWLSQHIKETGLDGIGYMERARNHLRSTKELTAEKKMKATMKSEY